MRVRITKEAVEEGMSMPTGYAPAYQDFRIQVTICYPIGIHLIVRWSRDFVFWISKVGYPGYRQKVEREAYLEGIRNGSLLKAEDFWDDKE